MRKLSKEEVREKTLDMMDHIHNLCEAKGIEYYLFYGTLLGAVRHKGFIPWDDDFDIAMTRSNYIRFCDAVEKENNEIYKLCNRSNTENYYYGVARYADTRYKYVSDVSGLKAFDNGIFIDVYPLDNFGNSLSEAESIKKRCMKLNTAYMVYLNKRSLRGGLRSIIRTAMHYYYKIKYGRGLDQTIDDMLFRKIQSLTSDSDSQIGLICWDSTVVPYEKNALSSRIKCEFEDREYWIPTEYDQILTLEYGDYLKLPPEKERVATHNYSIYEE